ncbi:hypothetical protein [Bacillus sp. EAC]|uniref:hypothetical protein n=1 Tax=Bacillus sp. EAC TaxID=1978338 RepID=UPI000B44E02E|nr:hypothetical protein [Bacillus sp. EAC]
MVIGGISYSNTAGQLFILIIVILLFLTICLYSLNLMIKNIKKNKQFNRINRKLMREHNQEKLK